MKRNYRGGPSLVLLCLAATSLAAEITKPTLYVVGYSHLDTEWCWSYPQVIREFIPNTLHQNFDLFEKYPGYVFNWTGSNRYRFMKEYYPEDYAKLKQYVAGGRWFPAGSSIEEGDVNAPSEESLIRQVMYGNQFFRREFGKQSLEFMLPDCFGFPASLPSVLAHCGLKGFSTQKLTWGSAVGIPFNVGNWIGPDGRSVVAALNPGSYGSHVETNLSTDQAVADRLANDQVRDSVPVDYHYYGTGDVGGAPDENSVKNVMASIAGGGPTQVFAGEADQMFKDLSPDQVASLPSYTGDLELTQHSAGSLTSEGAMKRWNRKNEILGDDAERAAVTADWLGALPYDRDRITDAWLRFLPGQFHDLMAGTALPRAYNFAWNDQLLASNEFADSLTASVGAVARGLDTRVKGVPLVVYNPLSIARNDIVEATVAFPSPPSDVQVFSSDGAPVLSQIESQAGNQVKIAFLAGVPSVGFTVFDVRPVAHEHKPSTQEVGVKGHTLWNGRYRVTIDANGDVASVFDKEAKRELLSAPARLEFMHENPADWPAWNMDWSDQKQPPRGYVTGPAKIEIAENGPARVALRVTREIEGSRFVQTIRLAAGDAGNRVEFANVIDWRGKETALKAAFPLTVSNPFATYNWDLGTVQRGNNDPKKYEVASHRWFDLTNQDGAYGVSVLNDCKNGSDKPSDNELRLTLIYTPGIHGGYQHQASQDWGRNEMLYALEGHRGDWRQGGSQLQAMRLNQPLLAFQTSPHSGVLGGWFGMGSSSNPNVSIEAMKKAEDSNEIVVRLNELAGEPQHGVRLHFAGSIVSAREIDGQEAPIDPTGPLKVDRGSLVVDMAAYRPRAFALKLAGPSSSSARVASRPLPLPFDTATSDARKVAAVGGFDSHGDSLPAELIPARLVSGGVEFSLKPRSKNAVACHGQSIPVPGNGIRKLFVLTASRDGDTVGAFGIGSRHQNVSAQAWDGFIGQWDNRLWGGVVPEEAYDWHNPLVGLQPAFVKRAPIAWYADHRRLADGKDDIYKFCYLFRQSIDVPPGVQSVTLPQNPKILILAATVAGAGVASVQPAQPLYDTLDRSGPLGPSVMPKPSGHSNDAIRVQMENPEYFGGATSLHFTLDGSAPTSTSPVASGPVWLYSPTTVRVAQLDGAGQTISACMERYDVVDQIPPAVTSVTGLVGSPTVQVSFSKPVDPASAASPDHYRLSNSETPISVSVGSDARSATLHLKSPLPAGAPLTVSVSGIHDPSPTAVAASVTLPVALLQPVFTHDDVQEFSAQTRGLTFPSTALPTSGAAPWSISGWVTLDKQPEDLTPIFGFGDGSDSGGAERFLINNRKSIYFWGSSVDINGGVPFDLHRRQFIVITYDGATIRIYKDGKLLKEEEASLSDAEPEARIAPRPAWDYGHRFEGKTDGFAIWSQALPSDYVTALYYVGEKNSR